MYTPPKQVGPFTYEPAWASRRFPAEDLVRYIRQVLGEQWREGLTSSEEMDLLLLAREKLYYQLRMGG